MSDWTPLPAQKFSLLAPTIQPQKITLLGSQPLMGSPPTLLGQTVSQNAPSIMGSAPTKQNLLDQAIQQYPALSKYPTQFKASPNAQDFMLEHWSPGMADNGLGYARPGEFGADQYGVEVYSDKATPSDVAADIVSHRMTKEDPVVKRVYEDFSNGLNPQQQSILQEQYKWAQDNEGDKRSFSDWKDETGLPAAFRGQLFNQWPQEFNDQFYTQDQKQKFKALDYYLRNNRP